MSSYDKWVTTYPINPPVGGFGWGAKAKVKKTGTGRTDDFHDLSEHWGKTKEEAEAKANAEADQWIANRRAT